MMVSMKSNVSVIIIIIQYCELNIPKKGLVIRIPMANVDPVRYFCLTDKIYQTLPGFEPVNLQTRNKHFTSVLTSV